MKKLSIVIALILFGKNGKAQVNQKSDSLKKNEISVSVSPLLLVLGGASDMSNQVNFNFGYKRYLNEKLVLRTAVVLFANPNNNYQNGMQQYYKTIDTVNVFSTSLSGGGIKSQLNIGLEKIYKYNRLTHGYGAEVFVNHQFVNRQELYSWRTFSYTPSVFIGFNDTTNYHVDSLGYYQSGVQLGGGFQIFYSLRYKISKRWALSATIGPSFNIAWFNGNNYDRRTKKDQKLNYTSFNYPNVPLISDVSLVYRF